MRVIDEWGTKKESPNHGLGVIEGYPGEIEFKTKRQAMDYQYRMQREAAEERSTQSEKKAAQGGRGFGSGRTSYESRAKPQKTANTAFQGGRRGGFGSAQAQNTQNTDATLGGKLLRAANAGSGKFFSAVGQFGNKIVGGLEEAEQYLNGGWTSDGEYVKGDSPIVSSLLGWAHGAADSVTEKANAELDRSARNWSGSKAGQVFNKVAVNSVAAIPQALLAFWTGGASAAGELGAQAGMLEMALRSLVSNPRFWLTYGQNAGESYAKAKAAGASNSDALASSTFSGLTGAMIDLGGGYENSGWMADRSLSGGQVMKNLGKSVLEQSGEEYAKGVAGRLAEKSYSPDKQWYSTKDENAVFNPKRDARQFAADAATAALVESSGYAARRLGDGWNGWGRKQREEDHLLSEEEFDTAFERGYNADEKWKEQNDQAIREQIRSEPEKLIINPEKQARHMRESKGYIPGRSYVTIGENDLQELVSRYAGTGSIQRDRNGNYTNKEILTFSVLVGVSINPKTGVATATNKLCIYYSKTGVHVVPTLKGE